ncbi:MAG TPA: dienelactone hydrolase family protein [Bacteroidota bacterium]|nr:dienelactone hydrolase family protein [Bacteroidota bacterium]
MADGRGQFVQVSVADGTRMRLYVSRPQGAGLHPGIMVFQEAYGVNAHIRDVADRFAALGYTAASPELYHRTREGFEGTYSDFEATRPYFSAITNDGLESDIRATHQWLTNDPATDGTRLFSAGFCIGGRVSFIANSVVRLRAAASFYGGGIAPANLDRVSRMGSPMLFFWGGLDRHIGPEITAQITAAFRAQGKPYVNVEFADADHGFFCDARASYNTKAAHQAFALLQAFYREHGGV